MKSRLHSAAALRSEDAIALGKSDADVFLSEHFLFTRTAEYQTAAALATARVLVPPWNATTVAEVATDRNELQAAIDMEAQLSPSQYQKTKRSCKRLEPQDDSGTSVLDGHCTQFIEHDSGGTDLKAKRKQEKKRRQSASSSSSFALPGCEASYALELEDVDLMSLPSPTESAKPTQEQEYHISPDIAQPLPFSCSAVPLQDMAARSRSSPHYRGLAALIAGTEETGKPEAESNRITGSVQSGQKQRPSAANNH
jgi:hypothetical protein